jgi:hypothetical protein
MSRKSGNQFCEKDMLEQSRAIQGGGFQVSCHLEEALCRSGLVALAAIGAKKLRE